MQIESLTLVVHHHLHPVNWQSLSKVLSRYLLMYFLCLMLLRNKVSLLVCEDLVLLLCLLLCDTTLLCKSLINFSLFF